MKSGFLILTLCFCCCFISSAEEVFTDYGTRISFNKYSQDYFVIRKFIIKLEKNVVKLLRQRVDDQPNVHLTISLTEPGTDFKASFDESRMNVSLSVRFEDWETDYEVLRRLICCFYVVRCKIPVKNETELVKAVPYWIQLGTLEYIRNRTELGYSGFRFYSLLRNAELAGVEPEPDDIINSTVTQKDGILFYYHRELCELMLDWVYRLSSSGDMLLRDMIVKTAVGGVSPVDVFYAVGLKRMVGETGGNLSHNTELSDRDQVRKWFRHMLRKEVVNGFMPVPADQSLAGVMNLWNVTYEYKEKDGGIIEKTCKLDELGQVWNEVNNHRVVLKSLREKLRILEQESAQEFIRPLNIIIDTLNSLPDIKSDDEKRQDAQTKKNENEKSDKKETKRKPTAELSKNPRHSKKNEEEPFSPAEFQRNIQAAASCFEDVVKHRRQVEEYLDQCSVEFIPVRERYKYLLGTWDIIEENDRKIRPELNKYLDQVEKDYIED